MSGATVPQEIRGMRAMAVVRWILFVVMAVVAAGSWYVFELREEPVAEGPDRFYCPMHPQIRAHDTGTCPICFMKLEPIPDDRAAPQPMPPPSASAAPPAPGEVPEGTKQVMLTTERQQTVGIAIAEAEEETLSRELRFAAVVDAPQRAMSEVRVRVDAFIEQVNPAEAGQAVKAGEPMVWIHSADLVRAQNELLLAASSPIGHSGEERAAATSSASPLLDAARDRLGLLGMHKVDIDAVLKSGKTKRLVPIRALSSGVVAEKRAVVGSVASPQDVLFRIIDLDKTWVIATVPNEELGLVRAGLGAVFRTQSGERKVDVEASVVEPAIATETRTARVRFVAKKGVELPLPGEIGTVVVSLPEAPYVVVPRDAVIDTGQARYVFIEVAPGVFEPRTVRPGALLGERRAIEAGVKKGDRVVARGAFVLDSESRLQAALAPASPSPAAPSPSAPAHSGHP